MDDICRCQLQKKEENMKNKKIYIKTRYIFLKRSEFERISFRFRIKSLNVNFFPLYLFISKKQKLVKKQNKFKMICMKLCSGKESCHWHV